MAAIWRLLTFDKRRLLNILSQSEDLRGYIGVMRKKSSGRFAVPFVSSAGIDCHFHYREDKDHLYKECKISIC